MTREAAQAGFERFVDDVLSTTASEFRLASALRGATNGSTRVIDAMLSRSDAFSRRVIEPELRGYRQDVTIQFSAILDYAESDEPPAAFHDRLLETDTYAAAIDPTVKDERRTEIEGALIDRAVRFGDALGPLLESDRDAFWPAVCDAFTPEEATAFVDTHFRFTGPLAQYPDAFVFETSIDPSDVLGAAGRFFPTGGSIQVDFTDEASRAMTRAEERVIRQTCRELHRHY